jgi:signal transduction histidine kinase
MEEMLNRFLEVARPTEPRRVSLCGEDLVTEALTPFAERFEAAGLALEWQPRERTTLWIDPFWLRQALVNLLENALGCVPRGGRVRLESRRLGGTWRLSVQDDGPGIEPELREKVLSPFVSLRQGGTGLGLALVQKIVTSHDGRVEVLESAWGGARFDLLFPCDSAPQRPGSGRAAAPPRVN